MLARSAPQAKTIAANGSLRLADVYTPDTSIPNSSSIALIISAGNKRALFLGDAWAEDVVASLLPLQATTTPIIFDAIKVSHHGSLHNTSVDLLSVADSPCFLISSDGSRHGHPDFEVLAEIVDRPAPFKRHLFFNYETAASKRLKAHTSKSNTAFSIHVAEHDWIQVG
jgi:beta-lactamase superfamily II metal-dependent hydrolase